VNYTVNCNSPCSTITVDPQSTLGEGRYLLALKGVKSEEGSAFTSPDARYAVPFKGSGSIVGTCPLANSSPPDALTVTDPNETGTLDFDWTSNGNWSVEALAGGTTQLGVVSGTAGSGHRQLVFSLGGHGTALSVSFRFSCSGTSGSVSNMLASRVP
jgi:hypothetical protein